MGENCSDSCTCVEALADIIIMTLLSILQMGEVWTEIMSELEQENVRPVSPDQEAIETIHRAITEDAKSVILIQHDLLRAQNDQVRRQHLGP